MFSTVAVCATVTTVTGAIVSSGRVDGWERSVLLHVNRWPDWLEPPLWVIQTFGLLGTPVVVAIIVWAVSRRPWTTMTFVAVVPLKLLFEKGIVKQIVERERPAVSVGAAVQVRGPALEGLSFPSGHATTAFAIAVLLTAIMPRRWRAVPFIWAVAVAVARIYMGEHNLLDVVAGAAIGIGCAVVLWYLMLNRDVTRE